MGMPDAVAVAPPPAPPADSREDGSAAPTPAMEPYESSCSTPLLLCTCRKELRESVLPVVVVDAGAGLLFVDMLLPASWERMARAVARFTWRALRRTSWRCRTEGLNDRPSSSDDNEYSLADSNGGHGRWGAQVNATRARGSRGVQAGRAR